MPTRSAKTGGRWWDTRTNQYVSRARRSRRKSSVRSKVLRMKQALTCGGHRAAEADRDDAVSVCMALGCHLYLCEQCASVIVCIEEDTDYYCDKHAARVKVTYQ